MRRRLSLKALLLCALSASALFAQWNPANPPAQPGSGMPFLATSPAGELYLSWIDPLEGKGHALRFARWEGRAWSAAETISEGRNWFVNWADFPSLAIGADGTMLAHWLVRSERGGQYGYGIRVARREPGERGQWRQIAAFNENDPADYAGFLSFAGSRAAYLAPPQGVRAPSGAPDHGREAEHIKTLRLAEFGKSGQLIRDRLLDADVCSCCQTSSIVTPTGLLIAYRDRLPGEIRDISIIRIRDGEAGVSEVLHRDGWQIHGCPTEGPSGSAAGDSVGIAWLTRAGGKARLQVAWSRDGGARFQPPVVADDGDPLGRPHLLALNPAESLLLWIEKTAKGAEIRLRRVGPDGRIGRSVAIAAVAASRQTGLPRVGVFREQVLVAWREDAVRSGWRPLASVPAMPPLAKDRP